EGLPVELVTDPVKTTGIEKANALDRFSSILTRLSMQVPFIYTPYKPGEIKMVNTNEKFNSLQQTMTMNIWDGRLTRELQFVKNIREKFPHITVKDCSPKIWNMRKIKSTAEVNLIRRAAQLGVEAHEAFIKATGPGVREKELAALFTYTCMRQDAMDMAYNVIVMSGPNHKYGHYHIYDRTLEDGDFIILDAGPDVGYYNADVSTTFPANRKFSPEQKEIYELAYGIYVTCLKNYRPGTTFKEVGNKVKEHLIENGFDPEEQRFRGLIRYGGYNHSIGMATHDPMGSFAGSDELLQPGFVFACDINMPYADQEMGIRIEDTVVITEDGCENLSQGLPRSLKEIEAFMKK
ncbi:MAG: Xaa-Pro peptidase family protein, partial [Candidatus Aminicenantes bacterium]|nr:Xaa-Pro peptidase family protein [Candidatus Aminicenantes bacterium]